MLGGKGMSNILEVRNIEKYYGNKEAVTKAINDISFSVEKGEFVGIMGPSGSGKSTLLNCISTIDNVTTGHIFIDNVDITRLKGSKIEDIRRDKLGFIFQDFNLLDTLTAYENIALALTINNKKGLIVDKSVKEAAEKLNIKDVLNKYPYQMSGGQKQRLSIARAIAKHPDVYIFDDSFSALDYKTDTVLRSALKEKTTDSVVLIVAQRISTILHAEQIIVLDDGKIVGKGTHEELLKTCDAYYQIAASQLSESELKEAMKEED